MYRNIILLILSILGLVQTFFYPVCFGMSKDNIPLLFVSSIARNFLLIFSAMNIIYCILLFIFEKNDNSGKSNNFTIFMIVVQILCVVLSML